MAVAGQEQSRFECDFVESPQSSLQSGCPICLHVLQRPTSSAAVVTTTASITKVGKRPVPTLQTLFYLDAQKRLKMSYESI